MREIEARERVSVWEAIFSEDCYRVVQGRRILNVAEVSRKTGHTTHRVRRIIDLWQTIEEAINLPVVDGLLEHSHYFGATGRLNVTSLANSVGRSPSEVARILALFKGSE